MSANQAPIHASSPQARSRAAALAVVVSASLAMAATLPGRTHGLGLITTRLLDDFATLNDIRFAQINLVATLLGSLFCIPCGWLIDRYGVRPVLSLVLLSLAGVVLAMSKATTPASLAVAIALTRGIGQGMLSVISIAMMGKWFRRNAGPAMGGYAVLMTLFMAAGTGVLASRVAALGWRTAWSEAALALVVVTILASLLARSKGSPAGDEGEIQHDRRLTAAADGESSATTTAALGASCFWVFALSISLFGLVTSGVMLFQQLILEERGLSEAVYHVALVIGLLAGVAANLVAGWLSNRYSMSSLLAIAMTLLAGSLAALPLLRTAWHAYLQATVGGIAGGVITVLFFSVWGHAFGPKHLGRIQSIAQMMTVLASAAGPLIVATGRAQLGSYLPVLAGLAVVAALLALCAAFTPVPCAARGDWSERSVLPDLPAAPEAST